MALLGLWPARARAQTAACVMPPDAVVAENCLVGPERLGWRGPDRGRAELLVSAPGAARGETVAFAWRAGLRAARLELYRLGFYAGARARLVALVSSPPEAPSTAVWQVPAGAASGVYVARLKAKGRLFGSVSARAFFVVRDDGGRSDLIFLVPRAPLSKLAIYAWPALRWLEANGYDVSYVSSADVAARPGLLLGHRAVIVPRARDELGARVRKALEAARQAGVSLAYLGGRASPPCAALEIPLAEGREPLWRDTRAAEPLDGRPARFRDLRGCGRGAGRPRLEKGRGSALVFDAGSARWAWGLDNAHPGPARAADPALAQATVNFLADMGVEPGALRPGLKPAWPAETKVPAPEGAGTVTQRRP